MGEQKLMEQAILVMLGKPNWRVAYWDHGSVVIESPSGWRERHSSYSTRRVR